MLHNPALIHKSLELYLHLKPKTLPLPPLLNLLHQLQDLIEQDQQSEHPTEHHPIPEREAWPDNQWLGNLPWEGPHQC